MKEHTNHLGISKLPALNLDVVTQIMGYSKCGTISEIMKACRAYYSIGVPILLRRPVEISSSEFLSSFYYFIFATNLGPTDRARFLRTIIWDHDVDIPRDDRNDYYDRGISPTAYTRKQYEQDRGDALKFMYILSHASGLEYLDFTQGSSQQFIEFCPDAVDTLANLARLRSLHICHGTTTDVNWFLRAKSPIVALAIDFRGHASDNQELSTFSRFRDTLVSLEIWDLMLRPGDENLRFPRVRRFRIEANYGQLPIPASYVFQIFPNIQVLELPSHFEDATYGDYNESNIQNQRSLNLAQVRKLEPAQRNLHLKELRGCAADLFRGAYECTVENLSVVRLDCWDFQWFLPLLPQMRPVSLLLQFNVCDREPGPIQIVEMALQKLSTTNTLENLSLFIDLPGPQDASSIHWCKEDLYTAFAHASIETLTIVCGRGYRCELRDYWKTGHVVESVVCKIVEASKTLRTVIVGDWNGTHTFNISQDFVPSYYEKSMTDQSRVWFHYSFSHLALKWPVSDGDDTVEYDIDV